MSEEERQEKNHQRHNKSPNKTDSRYSQSDTVIRHDDFEKPQKTKQSNRVQKKKNQKKEKNGSSEKKTTFTLSRKGPKSETRKKIQKIPSTTQKKKSLHGAEIHGKICAENQRCHIASRPQGDIERRIISPSTSLNDHVSNKISFESLLFLKNFYKSSHPLLETEFGNFIMAKIVNKELQISS